MQKENNSDTRKVFQIIEQMFYNMIILQRKRVNTLLEYKEYKELILELLEGISDEWILMQIHRFIVNITR